MNKRNAVIVAAVIAIAGLWFLFRPEKLFVNKSVNEGLPMTATAASPMNPSMPAALVGGKFHSGAHDTSGNATIYQTEPGKRLLRLTNFKTSNGPDVHVYLVAANDATDNDTVKKAGFVDLGSIKGNEGDQNYELPSDADLAKYHAVTIWCARFNVNFGTAPLQQSSMNSGMQMPGASSPASVLAGQFHKGAHDTSGTAAIYQLEDGKRILRLTNFKTSNGPDVHVYLVAANDATDNDTVKKAGFLDLGSIKGNEGDQNYELPANADLSKDRAVTIWCARFNVNFGTAPLAQQMIQQ
jgi:electron transfer DM13